jgi:ubiquinone/menaquinone biosynthesis C-methylase UbiE
VAGGLKRLIGGIYSYAADRFYEPVVVRGAFRVLGGKLHDAVLEQGRRAVVVARGRPILDMPVGTATFTIEHARTHGGLVVGSDIAEGMVRAARTNADAAGVGNLAMVRADAHHLPFADGAFGSVLCSNGLQVMPGTEFTLKELARVLAPDGTLFISIVSIPLSRVAPGAADHLPVILRSGRHLAGALKRAGLQMTNVDRTRLAWLIEARHR